MANNTITSPKGFLAAGVSCGIKQSGKLDLGLIVCPTGATAAAVFTTNKITSAAVEVSRKHIKSPKIYAVVVNSGNANACTGKTGIRNAQKMCALTASLLNRFTRDERRGMRDDGRNVLVASTGIIGHQLPMNKIIAGISKAAGQLSSSAKAGLAFTKAIMTTDTRPKQAVRLLEIDSVKITIAGAVKGAGMIAPNMATTLCFITTDVAISNRLLSRVLKTAIDNSLNRLTVDGHQSTNDTAVILASGLAGNRPIVTQCPRYKKFTKVLTELCDDLAKQMALGAEGATRMFKVVVIGAASKIDAAKAARAISNYDLVKCAIHGGDPNWGRIICAVGSVGVKLNPMKLSCKLGDITVFKNGTPKKFDAKKASKVISQTEHIITVDLSAGSASDFCYGCDLGHGYVTINAEYHT
ncbi:MAG: bifunctional glutamate N-acetyltransferase/amino-acid acetyltransferase ArgJ [Sedimentisphaerales bacterium]|nr:bifunctional glutamate N-acetyltransferase/amino-acid acetyltransferase ArgJ [Sedimentisphaerales bacterium]